MWGTGLGGGGGEEVGGGGVEGGVADCEGYARMGEVRDRWTSCCPKGLGRGGREGLPVKTESIEWDEWIIGVSEQRANTGFEIVGKNVLAGVGEVFLVDVCSLRRFLFLLIEVD